MPYVDCSALLTKAESYGDRVPEEPDNVVEVRRKLEHENEKGRKLFGYAYLDDKYGMFSRDPEQHIEAFNRGEDQNSYDQLISIVNTNRACAKTS